MDQEILGVLERLEKYDRQQTRTAKIHCVVSVISMLCCAAALAMVMFTVPKIEKMTVQTERFVKEASGALEDIQTASENISQLDLGPVLLEVKGLLENVDGLLSNVDGLVSNVDTLVTTTQDGLEDTLEKIGKVDFDMLNKAIQDLADVVEPLARFFNTFDK